MARHPKFERFNPFVFCIGILAWTTLNVVNPRELQRKMIDNSSAQSPLACDMSAIPPNQRETRWGDQCGYILRGAKVSRISSARRFAASSAALLGDNMLAQQALF
jgi:hypothetical protein